MTRPYSDPGTTPLIASVMYPRVTQTPRLSIAVSSSKSIVLA